MQPSSKVSASTCSLIPPPPAAAPDTARWLLRMQLWLWGSESAVGSGKMTAVSPPLLLRHIASAPELQSFCGLQGEVLQLLLASSCAALQQQLLLALGMPAAEKRPLAL